MKNKIVLVPVVIVILIVVFAVSRSGGNSDSSTETVDATETVDTTETVEASELAASEDDGTEDTVSGQEDDADDSLDSGDGDSGSADTYSSDDGAVLSDIGVFLNCERGEDQDAFDNGHLVSYFFDMDNGDDAVGEVIELLQEPGYELTMTDARETDFTEYSALYIYTYEFSYTGSDDDVSPMTDDDGNTFDVRVVANYHYDAGSIMLSFYYSNGFTLVEPGSYAVSQPDDYNSSGSSSGTSSGDSSSSTRSNIELDCVICGGSGNCTECGGDGYLWSSASDQEDRNCWKCNASGKCIYCNGTGKR
ncbi:MAG: hypothetical protein LUE14_01930 [Clostridiales bacterium]|nr:hypothetical protein [Clostridiales bacterium]